MRRAARLVDRIAALNAPPRSQRSAHQPREMIRLRGPVLLTLLAGVAGLQTLRTAPIRRRCALRMNAEAAVNEWCMSSGREDAAITILEGQDTAQVPRREE